MKLQPELLAQLPVVPNTLPLPTSVGTCPFVFGKRGVTPDGVYDSSWDKSGADDRMNSSPIELISSSRALCGVLRTRVDWQCQSTMD